MPVALITGISGQDGAYLSQFLLQKNYRVIGLVRNTGSSLFRLEYLGIRDEVVIDTCDLLNLPAVKEVIDTHQPDEIYNLAAQSSVAASFQFPHGTLHFNINSVLNILESIKELDSSIKFYQASSSEMYGRVKNLPITEDTVMHPLSPYAISKSAAHWISVNYRESYGLFACCGILFNHESYLRGENYFTKKVIGEALEIKKKKRDVLKVGNIDIKRDFGYSPRYVEAMWLMMQQAEPDDYIICSGRSLSLRDIIGYIFRKLDIDPAVMVIDQSLFRPNEIADIYGNNSKAKMKLGWDYSCDFFDVLDTLIEEEERKQQLRNSRE
jgi:GDPmannose 4,6-dehydratase